MSAAVEVLLARLRVSPNARLVAIAGIPGSGKSTLAAAVCVRVPGAVVVPMDGYHLPRRMLDADALRRRGAPDTFDAVRFREDLLKLRKSRVGVFPAFDHAEQDPRPGAITVEAAHSPVLVEGLYLLLREWRCSELFDLRVFVDCPLDIALQRVASRHRTAGICNTETEARHRAETNDRRNAMAILEDGCRERADVILPS
jgi:pantothenate kinase